MITYLVPHTLGATIVNPAVWATLLCTPFSASSGGVRVRKGSAGGNEITLGRALGVGQLGVFL